MWVNYGVPKVSGLTLSVLADLASGLPYGASGSFSASAVVNAAPYVTNPGYITPQGGANEIYYYTARDAFRTDWSRRADFAASYNPSVRCEIPQGRRIQIQAQSPEHLHNNSGPGQGCGDTRIPQYGGPSRPTGSARAC